MAWFLDDGAAGSLMRICAIADNVTGSTVAYELAGDGSASASPSSSSSSSSSAAPALPCGAEFDTFLAPTDGEYNNALPGPNLIPQSAGAPSLGDMASLTVSFTARLTSWGVVAPRCGAAGSCGPSGKLEYGYAVMGIVLSNPTPNATGTARARGGLGPAATEQLSSSAAPSSQHSPAAAAAAAPLPPETLFYQLILADTRAASPNCAANDPCTTNFSYWFFPALPTLGVSDAASYMGVPCLRPDAPAPTSYDLPLLPRIAGLIRDGAERYGADPDLSHWYVTGLYVGTGLEGSARAGIVVEGVDAVYEPAAGG